VFGAAAIDAVVDIAGDAHLALVLSGLVADAWYQRNELGKVAAIELQLSKFFGCDRARQFGTLGIYFRQTLSTHGNFTVDVAQLQFDVDPRFLGHAQRHTSCLIFAEPSGSYRDVVLPRRKSGREIFAVGIALKRACRTGRDVSYDDACFC